MKTPQVIRESPTSLLLLLLLTGVCIDAYRPVVIVHGFLEGSEPFKYMAQYINESHPGTEVEVISLYNMCDSLTPLKEQVQNFRKVIDPIMENAPDGIILLCYSQGGLICRAILSQTPNHTVHTFISLSSPQAGQFGETDFMWLPDSIKRVVYLFCYNSLGQRWSVCNYWNDPHQRASYLQNNIFLPLLNGDKPHPEMQSWRENFLRIKKLVLIGGPDDGVITPWESSKFGFYDSDENVVQMTDQEFYKNDTFGLKTLNDRRDLSTCVLPGVDHLQWQWDRNVFNSCIEKWLT